MVPCWPRSWPRYRHPGERNNPSVRDDSIKSRTRSLLLFLLELGLADIRTAKLDVEDALEIAEELLVGDTLTTLVLSDDGLGRVAAGGELLLGHGLVADHDGAASLLDGGTDLLADGLGLDDVVGAVNHC